MITPVECFILSCDNCKEYFENTAGHGVFADEKAMVQDSYDEGWHEQDGKHYCGECAKLDEDIDDKLNIDLSRFKPDGDDLLAEGNKIGITNSKDPLEKDWPNSSTITKTVYHPEEQVLFVTFKTGTYQYTDVPLEVWSEMCLADSVGSFLAKNIKGKFEATKIS